MEVKITNYKDLLDNVDHLKVWYQLIGVDNVKIPFRSPFRHDPKPGCKLYRKGNSVKFRDPSRNVHYDIVDAFKVLNPQVTEWSAIRDAILAMSGSAESTKAQLQAGTLVLDPTVLSPIITEWTDWGISFWEARGVTLEQLNRPETFTQEILGYSISGKDKKGNKYSKKYKERGFVYWVGDKLKLYMPEAKIADRKFRSHLLNDDVWHLKRGKTVDGVRTLLIAKANKDLLVWEKFVKADLLNLTAERVFPTPDWLMANVVLKYDRIAICLDPDPTGLAGMVDLKEMILKLNPDLIVRTWAFPDLESKDLDKYRFTHTAGETFVFLKENGFYSIFD